MIAAILRKETIISNQNDYIYLNPASSFEIILKLSYQTH